MVVRSAGTTPSNRPPLVLSPAWRRLVRGIEDCRRCPLGTTRRHVVVYRGSSSPRVVFVGEAPGAEEDAVGVPFVGRAGRRLESAVAAIGLTPEEYGVLNLFKCRPADNRFDRTAAAACRPFLDRQLAMLNPALIVTLGAHALEALSPGRDRIGLVAGRAIEGGRPAVFPLLHPAAAMHNPNLRTRWERDFAELGRYLLRPRETV